MKFIATKEFRARIALEASSEEEAKKKAQFYFKGVADKFTEQGITLKQTYLSGYVELVPDNVVEVELPAEPVKEADEIPF